MTYPMSSASGRHNLNNPRPGSPDLFASAPYDDPPGWRPQHPAQAVHQAEDRSWWEARGREAGRPTQDWAGQDWAGQDWAGQDRTGPGRAEPVPPEQQWTPPAAARSAGSGWGEP